MTTAMRVLLVDDHPIISELLAVNLEAEGFDVKVSPSLQAPDVLALVKEFEPGIVLLDLDLGESLSIPLIRPISSGGATVVVLTGMKEPALLGQCLEEGAFGVLSKESDFDALRQAVVDAAEGKAVISERRRIDLLDAASKARLTEKDRLLPFRDLTKREVVVLGHLVNAKSAEEIAGLDFVSLATVRTQIQSVLRKLGVNSQLAAVAMANERGWSPDA